MQQDIWPVASRDEIAVAKAKLAGYRKARSFILEMERRGINSLAPLQIKQYNACMESTQAIESAVRLILDEDIRRLIETRYLNGVKHCTTVIRFADIHPSTVDRRLNAGIESVANSLKLLQ